MNSILKLFIINNSITVYINFFKNVGPSFVIDALMGMFFCDCACFIEPFSVFNFFITFAVCHEVVEFADVDGAAAVCVEEIEGYLDILFRHQLVLINSCSQELLVVKMSISIKIQFNQNIFPFCTRFSIILLKFLIINVTIVIHVNLLKSLFQIGDFSFITN